MNEMSHRYAVILAADVVHYSRLMEGDGERTVEALKDCRDIFKRCVSSHHGREFGSVGDSLMAEFQSPVEALRAAKDVHVELNELDPVNGDERLQVRIGLHAGDVISDGDNLFGDVVNTASRLQAMAQPGSTTLSGLVHTQVKKEAGFQFRSLGQRSLKNIAEPVQVYEVERQHRKFNWRRIKLAILPYRLAIAVTLGVIGAGIMFIVYFEAREQPGISGTIEVPVDNSIAVLPFQSQGLTDDEGAFFHGIHGEILMQLAKLGSLDRVIARGSIERYRNTELSIRDIGQELDVARILAGSVQNVDNQVRVNVELIDALNDGLIWAESYDHELVSGNLIVIPSIIARDVVSALNITVTGTESEQLESIPTTDIEAYGEFMLGHNEMLRLTPTSLYQAEEHFRKAVDLDPDFALAYVGAADALRLQRKYDYRNFEYSFAERQEFVNKALAIDPYAGPAYASLASIQAEQGDAEGAEMNFLRSIELSPNYAMAHLWLGDFLGELGRDDESLASIYKALEKDPTAPPIKMSLAARLRWMGNVDEAIQVLLDGVKETPDFPEYYLELVINYGMTGRFAQSLRWADAGRSVAPHHMYIKSLRCFVLLNLGDFDYAERCWQSIEGEFPIEFVTNQVKIHLLRGDRDKAAELVEEYVNNKEARPSFRLRLGYFYFELGEPEKYLELIREIDPSRLDIPPDYAPEDMNNVLEVAFALYETGERDRANQLLDRAIEIIIRQSEHLERPVAPVEFPIVLPILALREDRTELIKTLRFLIDYGWCKGWFNLKSRYFDFVRDDPEFVELMSRLEEHAANEWRLYEELKDEPLF